MILINISIILPNQLNAKRISMNCHHEVNLTLIDLSMIKRWICYQSHSRWTITRLQKTACLLQPYQWNILSSMGSSSSSRQHTLNIISLGWKKVGDRAKIGLEVALIVVLERLLVAGLRAIRPIFHLVFTNTTRINWQPSMEITLALISKLTIKKTWSWEWEAPIALA